MAVAFRSAASTGVTAAATTGVTVTKPASLADLDVMYAFVSKTTYASTAHFTCAGWTEIINGGTVTGNDTHVTVLRKVVFSAAGEPANYTFVTTSATSSQMCGTIIAVSGADPWTPEDVATPTVSTGSNDATPASRAITTFTDNALVLQFHQLSLATTVTKTAGAPSGYTLDANATVVATSGSLDNQQAVAYKTQVTAGAAGTNVWTHTADDATTEFAIAAVAVRPLLTPDYQYRWTKARALQAVQRAAGW